MVLQHLAEIKEEQKLIKASLNELIRQQRGAEAIKSGQLPANVSLPLQTARDVDLLEEQLRSHETYAKVVFDNENCLFTRATL